MSAFTTLLDYEEVRLGDSEGRVGEGLIHDRSRARNEALSQRGQ